MISNIAKLLICLAALISTGCSDQYGIEGTRYKLVISNSYNNSGTDVFFTFTNVSEGNVNAKVELQTKKYKKKELEIVFADFQLLGLSRTKDKLFVISSSNDSRNKSVKALSVNKKDGDSDDIEADLMIMVYTNKQLKNKNQELISIAKKYNVNSDEILIGRGPISIGLKGRTYKTSMGCSGYGQKTCYLIPVKS